MIDAGSVGGAMRFMLIDRITAWELGKSAVAIKNVALSEDFFDDHFPQKPIMPGVLMLEGMAQLSGLLLEEAARDRYQLHIKALMSIVEKAKFRAPVYPGDRLVYSAEITSINEMGGKTRVHAECDGALRAQCALVFSFHEFDNERLQRRQQEVVELWRQGLGT
jgi:3-hydroxyacyl-[acyl-carrier-protein] dehydratase